MATPHSTKHGRDLTGLRFGLLVAVRPAERKGRNRTWLCRCDCGREHQVAACNLWHGNVKSCGCDRARATAAVHFTHGCSRNPDFAPEYRAWVALRHRCNYHPEWGGRGIKVCDRWKGQGGFANFLADMGRRPGPGYSVERKNNHGDYCPENCVWATQLAQHNNKRNNIFLRWRGERLTMAQWARKLGVSYRTLRGRVSRGWSAEQVLSTPFPHT